MELCILRPPLVYGPGVRANFLRLLHWVDRGYPLPYGAIRNRRGLIALGNLVDAIAICTAHPAAAGETFLVSDGEDLSTPELIRRLATQLQKPARLLDVPPALLRMVGSVTGRSAEIDRLLGDFHVDSTRIRELLTWNPPYSVNQALGETVAWYRDQRTLEKR
jgi:UDP-glucose 4-epimerase